MLFEGLIIALFFSSLFLILLVPKTRNLEPECQGLLHHLNPSIWTVFLVYNFFVSCLEFGAIDRNNINRARKLREKA